MPREAAMFREALMFGEVTISPQTPMSHRCHLLFAVGLALLVAAAPPVRGDRAGATSRPGWDLALAPPGEPGEPFVLEGRVLGANGSPLHNLLIHVYHADAGGRYSRAGESRPRLEGVLRTNVLGGFRVRTVLPGMAEGVPHLHFELAGPGADYRATTLNLCRATGAGSDSVFAGLPQMPTLPSQDTWAYVHRDARGVFQCRWDLRFSRAARLGSRPDAFARPRR